MTNINASRNSQDAVSWEKNEVLVERYEVDSETQVTVPAGRYFVGDPCYATGDDHATWVKWCDRAFIDPNRDEIGSGTYNGYPVIGVHTMYGDGEFRGTGGRSFPVDSGQIGVVAAEVMENMGVTAEQIDGLGYVIDFDEDVVIQRNNDTGEIIIGDIVIMTGDEPAETEFDEEFEEESREDEEEWH